MLNSTIVSLAALSYWALYILRERGNQLLMGISFVYTAKKRQRDLIFNLSGKSEF